MNRKCKCCGKKYDKPKTTVRTIADDICHDCFTIWTSVNAILGLETTLTPGSDEDDINDNPDVIPDDIEEEEDEEEGKLTGVPILFDWRTFKHLEN